MLEKIIIGALSALVGLVSGILLPWVRWQVEKARQRRMYRSSLTTQWRDAIGSFDFTRGDFGDSVIYSSMRPHLTKEAVEKFEAARTVYASGGRGEEVLKHLLLDEVARLEKKWRLV